MIVNEPFVDERELKADTFFDLMERVNAITLFSQFFDLLLVFEILSLDFLVPVLQVCHKAEILGIMPWL